MSYVASKYPLRKLSELADIQPGFMFKSESFTDCLSDIPLVKGENVQPGFIDWAASKFWPAADFYLYEKYHLVPRDVVLAMDRPWVTAGLKWAYVKKNDPKSLLVQRVARLRAKNELDQIYLRCLISSSYFSSYIQPIVTGVNIPHISGKQIGGFLAPVPPLATQEKIAAALSAYDDLIENNRRRIELLEQMAEELYREWFVRFRFPGYQQAKFEKGSPSTWQKKKFGEFCGLKRGYDLPDAQIEDGNFPIIASTSIKAFHNQFKVEPPVICTGRSGSLGTVLFVNERAWPLNTALYVQKFYGNSPYCIYFTLKNMGLASFNSGAGVPSLNRNHLNGISIAVPDKPLQQAFDKHVSVLFDQKEKLVEACSNLQKTRDALLTRLISGKLPVDQLDIQFPPSMREADVARQEVAHA